MTPTEKESSFVLKNLGIVWSFEQPLFVWDENKRPRVWTPDFYLKHLGIYLEVCGSKNFTYDYRQKIYDNNGYKVVFLHLYKETNKWKHHLLNYLQLFTHNRNHTLHQIINNGTKNNYN